MKIVFSALLSALSPKKTGVLEHKGADAGKASGLRGPLTPVAEIGLILLAIAVVLLVVLVT